MSKRLQGRPSPGRLPSKVLQITVDPASAGYRALQAQARQQNVSVETFLEGLVRDYGLQLAEDSSQAEDGSGKKGKGK